MISLLIKGIPSDGSPSNIKTSFLAFIERTYHILKELKIIETEFTAFIEIELDKKEIITVGINTAMQTI